MTEHQWFATAIVEGQNKWKTGRPGFKNRKHWSSQASSELSKSIDNSYIGEKFEIWIFCHFRKSHRVLPV